MSAEQATQQAENRRPPAIIVAGPTASGKSALALDLAEAFQGTVINADALQLYRDLRVLSARPEAADEARAPHRLYGVLEARQAASAGLWRGMALEEMAAATAVGRLPILCGGSGLYIKALVEGLAPVPTVPGTIRDAATADLARLGNVAFHAALSQRDPEMGARLRASDPQRMLRAWSVLEATGRSLAAWQALPPSDPAPYRLMILLLLPPRDILRARCDDRFEAMLARGAFEEVKGLLEQDLPLSLPVMKAIGVRELGACLRGELSQAEASSQAQAATRRYAKRQATWLRTQVGLEGPGRFLISEQYSESHTQRIFTKVRESLLTE